MTKIGRTKISRVRSLLSGLRSLTESLPTEKERATISSSIAELSAYLDRATTGCAGVAHDGRRPIVNCHGRQIR
jgi:hypothetical protein